MGHPNVYDRIMAGKEVNEPDVPAQHFWRAAGQMREGEGFSHEGRSWVVTGRREHERGVTFTAQPRAGFVGHHVISRLQFGTPGMTLEDEGERAFTFHPGQVVPVRG